MNIRILSWVIAIFFCFAANSTMAGTTPPLPVPPSQVQIQAQAQDPGTPGIVDKMNGYYLQYILANTIQNMEQDFNNRMQWEFHAGAGFIFSSNSDPSSYSFASLGIKLNLMNPKMVRPKDLLAEIKYLRTLLAIQKANSTDDLLAECDRMEKGTNEYLDQFWWKRLSIGLSFPMISNYAYYGNVDWSNAFVFLGYDLGDLVTLQAGYSTKNKIMVALSTDISTPTYAFVTNFFSSFRSFTGAPVNVGTPGLF